MNKEPATKQEGLLQHAAMYMLVACMVQKTAWAAGTVHVYSKC